MSVEICPTCKQPALIVERRANSVSYRCCERGWTTTVITIGVQGPPPDVVRYADQGGMVPGRCEFCANYTQTAWAYAPHGGTNYVCPQCNDKAQAKYNSLASPTVTGVLPTGPAATMSGDVCGPAIVAPCDECRRTTCPRAHGAYRCEHPDAPSNNSLRGAIMDASKRAAAEGAPANERAGMQVIADPNIPADHFGYRIDSLQWKAVPWTVNADLSPGKVAVFRTGAPKAEPKLTPWDGETYGLTRDKTPTTSDYERKAVHSQIRANELSDRCGALLSHNRDLDRENTQLLAENARLTRALAKAEKRR